jgi:hypothetical protein
LVLGGSPLDELRVTQEAFALWDGLARDLNRGDRFRRRDGPAQGNSTGPAAVYIKAMITSAIVFGMVGVAAGFTWDYVINRGK